MSINFMLPGMYEHHITIFRFLRILQDHPEWFIDNVKVGAIYGNFQFCIWDGGRIFTHFTHTNREQIKQVQEQYNYGFKVPIRFVFTNTEIKEENCYDRFNNVVLELCENEMNEIVVNSPILEKYIRKNYPKYQIISSTTKCLTKIEDFKMELANPNYKMVCLDYNLNKNTKLLSSLNQEEKEKCEFLINAICPPACPSRKEHYRLNSLFYLSYGRPYRTRVCGIQESNLFPSEIHLKNNLTPQDCIEYNKNGFCNFKMEGRTFDKSGLIANFVKYMVKPEYQFHVLHSVLKDEK